MPSNDATYSDVGFSVTGDVLSLAFNSEFGRISFSLNVNEFQAQLSRIISELFDRINGDDPKVLSQIAENSGASPEEVRKSLETSILYRKRGATRSAIDQFIQSRDLNLEGLVGQVVDNLPGGIVLMLMQLALAGIVQPVPDVQKNQDGKISSSNDELLNLINPHFKQAINQLWKRSPPQ